MALLAPAISGEVGLRLLLAPLSSNIVIRTASCAVGIGLPVYSTFRAIEKKDEKEKEWLLLYWAAYGSFSIAEVFADKLLSRSEEKENTWKLLRELKEKFDMPWLCCGDFNEILFNYEKEGGSPRAERCMENFRRALEDCELFDLGFVGDAFTWRNHHDLATSYTKERLDRAVANGAWRAKFPLVRVINGDPRHSNHRPIIINTVERASRSFSQPMDVLHKFEARWLEEEDCKARVEEAWLGAMEGGDVCMMEVQRRMLNESWVWDREVLEELERRIKNVRRELERCRRRCITQEHMNREHILRYKLELL